MHIPLVELSERHDELPRDRRLAFTCAPGVRSALALKATATHGLTAANVKGGLASRARAGLPVDIFEADFPPPMGGTGSAPNPLAYCFGAGSPATR